MKLTAPVKLLPTKEQALDLKRTMKQANEACNYLSQCAWSDHTFRQYNLHHLAYYDTREQFPDLSAQTIVRCIARVAAAYKLNRNVKCTFRPYSAIAYDAHILRWYTTKLAVSIWTVNGRQHIPFVCGPQQKALLQTQQGESDLALVHGIWYLLTTCNVEETPEQETEDVLGIDLGIVNLAADSDGQVFSGEAVETNRRILAHRRRNLQRKGTKATKRKLKELSGKQSRFQKNTNHMISKCIVQKAQDTNRAVAVENLTGIRSRTTIRRSQRARHTNWSFYQLKQFLAYKSKRAGIPLLEVDPRNTSRTCPICGCIDKRNRKTQATFSCVSCGYSASADTNAAQNIRARAIVNRPNELRLKVSASRLGTSPQSLVRGS
jgi:IS605 OrfB family transposase